MVQIHNSETIKELQRGAGIQISRDIIPNQIADKIVPVLEINPKFFRTNNIVRSNGSSTTGETTIYTTPSDRDFYLTYIQFATTSTATSDNTSTYVSLTPEGGTAVTIAALNKQTLTIDSQHAEISFDTPIKIKRGTAIVIGAYFTVGTTTKAGQIAGYLIETSNN